MNTVTKIIFIIILVIFSSFFSISEIALASARKIKLQMMEDNGNKNATKVMKLQESPGDFFAVVQIGLNALAILSGIVGENIAGPLISRFIDRFIPVLSSKANIVGSIISFLLITGFVIEFSDLIPKRMAMASPEKVAVKIINPMRWLVFALKPAIVIFNGIATFIFKILGIPQKRKENITYDEVVAVVDAGAEAGVVPKKEHYLIENIFELESRWITSIMTPRDSIIYLTLNEGEDSISEKITNFPHSKFVVCQNDIDSLLGYVDSKDILPRILKSAENGVHNIEEICQKKLLILPNTLTLSETLDRFNEARDDFAVVVNEYGFTVGLVTLNDVINTLMGDIVYQSEDEQQIIPRGDDSWLIDGTTPIEDVKKVLDIDYFPEQDTYETIAGFMMYMLKSMPKKAAVVEYENFKFEVVDVDHLKVDQLLVTKKGAELKTK